VRPDPLGNGPERSVTVHTVDGPALAGGSGATAPLVERIGRRASATIGV
jgi:hypothetical protein